MTQFLSAILLYNTLFQNKSLKQKILCIYNILLLLYIYIYIYILVKCCKIETKRSMLIQKYIDSVSMYHSYVYAIHSS